MNVQPQFRTVVRGFDPEQVTSAVKDMYTALTIARRAAADRVLELASAQAELERLRSELDATQSQLAELQASASSHAYGDVGERIGTILRLAEEESAQLRQSSADEARLVRETADEDAMRMRSAAQASADEIVQRAVEAAAVRREEADTLYHEHQTLLDQAQDSIQQQLAVRQAQAEGELAEDLARHESRVAELRVEADALAERCEATRQSARDEADSVLAQAGSEAAQLRRDAEAEVAELREDHQRIRGHLDRLHRVLGEMLDQTPEFGLHGESSAGHPASGHPSPTDLPGHGRWFLERVSHHEAGAPETDDGWEDVFDRRDPG